MIIKNKTARLILLVTGWLTVGLALLGVFLPLLPTTPFLLVSAYCFARSSYRWHRWLMYNKTFGKYLRNYKAGYGIPVRVKVVVITFLWLTISYCVIFLIPLLPVKALLIIIATAVTMHILHVKSLKSPGERGRKILVLSAEPLELEKFVAPKGVVVETIGIGATSATFHTNRCIDKHCPDFVILAGFAGAYIGSELNVGQSVIIGREYNADLGVIYGDGFKQIADCGFTQGQDLFCVDAEKITGFKIVDSNSVNCACFPMVKPIKGVENMEGASFFYVSLQRGIPFLELRTISNFVEPKRDSWDLPIAKENLAHDLSLIINQL